MKQLRSRRSHQSDREIQDSIRARTVAAERAIRLAVEAAAPELGAVEVVARMPIGRTGQAALLRHPHGAAGILACSVVTCRAFGLAYGSTVADVPAPCDVHPAALVQYRAEWRARLAMESMYRQAQTPSPVSVLVPVADQVLSILGELADAAEGLAEPEDRWQLVEETAVRVRALLAGAAVSS